MGTAQTPQDPLIGSLLGSYRVERRLGEGGMGIVYQAVHATLGQIVAIKVLRRNFSGDDKVLHRFFNEARAVGIVHHPGLVRIYDYQQTADGSAYIVMEFLQGEALDSRIASALKSGQGLPLAQVLHVGRQISSALAAAHAAGVVHCDLKPENVFLTRDADAIGGERVKILDFGIAKFLADSSGKKTTVGLILGTPKYMAPEQCEGRDSLTDKVDVYALGTILYEMVTGTPPFVAQTSSGLMRQHMMLDPPPLREKVPAVPADLHALVHEMMAKPATARPTMAQVVARLDSIKMHGQGAVSARAAGKRTVRPVFIGGAIFIIVGIGAGLLVVKAKRTGRMSAASTLNSRAVNSPGPGEAPGVPAGEHPPTGPEMAHEGGESDELKNRLQRTDKLKKHKLLKPAPAPALKDSNSPPAAGSTSAPASTAKPTASPAKTRSKLTDMDIEPDR